MTERDMTDLDAAVEEAWTEVSALKCLPPHPEGMTKRCVLCAGRIEALESAIAARACSPLVEALEEIARSTPAPGADAARRVIAQRALSAHREAP